MKTIIYLVLGAGLVFLMLPLIQDEEALKNLSADVTGTWKATVGKVENKTYYKWQDENGEWHFGDRPPVGAEVVEAKLPGLTNIIQSVDTSEFFAAFQDKESSEADDTPSSLQTLLNPEEALQTLDKAKEARQMMEERNAQLEEQFR